MIGRLLRPLSAWRARRKARRRAPAATLGTYVSPNVFQRHRKKWFLLLILFLLPYGAFFSLTGTIFLAQMLAPQIVLACVAIWVLPDDETTPPDRLIELLLFAFLAGLLLWPDYLAIALPGLPWITVSRLIGMPLCLVFLIGMSTSSTSRHALAEQFRAAPYVLYLMIAFIVIAIASVAVSTSISASINKLIVAIVNWFFIFFISCYVFRKPGRITFLIYMLWASAIVVSLLGIWEWRHSQVPWATHIPSFLTVQDESVQRILAGSSRSATGQYRVQSKYTTPLGLAEFYAICIPFVMHISLTAKRLLVRLLAVATVPFIFWMILLTDSRLGAVGFLITMVLYIFVWGFWRWRYNPDSLFGPALVLSYPVIFSAFVASTFLVRRIEVIVWGSGAQAASNESRKIQVASGIPKVFHHPWGYGIGRGADTLGFTNGMGVLTIDTYYLAVALEFGVVGFLVYYTMFANGIWNGVKRLPQAAYGEYQIIAPITIALINFAIIKSIFSQLDNHPLVFALLGALVALCYRLDQSRKSVAEVTRTKLGNRMARPLPA